MSQYVNEILKIPRLSNDESLELIALKIMGHEIARDILITHYLQYAYYIGCKFQDRVKQPMEDMIGIGSEAIIKAIDNYRPNSNATVQTVVYAYLKNCYSRHIEFHGAQQRDYSKDCSLQEKMFDEGPELSSSLPNQDEPLETILLLDELSYIIRGLLENLQIRDREIILCRYGFLDGKFHTLQETGKRLNLSAERIRQREKKALGKLKIAAKKQGLNQ